MRKAYLDSLAGLSDDGSDGASSSGSEGEGGGGAAAGKGGAVGAAKRQKNAIDLDTLKAHGYKAGPSILFVPDKAKDEQSWAWYAAAAPRRLNASQPLNASRCLPAGINLHLAG